MKAIEPLEGFWNNNGFESAHFINMRFTDNVKSEAVFYYEFLNESKQMLANGNFIIDGETYQNWDGSNEGAWNFAATKLGIIFIEN